MDDNIIMSNLKVVSMIPPETMVPLPVSTSKHILKSRQVDIVPNESGAYSYSGNDRIVFNISSSTELLNGLDSYIKFKLYTTDDEKSSATNTFDEGGVHGLFKTIELRTQSGVLIQRYERYNRWYAMKSNLYHSKDFVEIHGASEGDSVGVGANNGRSLIQGSSEGAGEVEFCFRPAVSFLEQPYHIPLMLIKQGLQLILELERPEIAINKGAANDTDMNYFIKDCRFVARMVTPDEEVVKQYLDNFNGMGINMQVEGVRHRRVTINASDTGGSSSNLQFGVRSARKVMAFIQGSVISENPGAQATKNNNSISTFLRTGLTSYQFKSGSEEFPDREVNIGKYNSELMKQQLITTNQVDKVIPSFRFTPDKLMAVNTVNAVDNETEKLIMCARTERDNSPYAGLDLSLNPLDVELKFDAVSNALLGNRVLNVFCHHDLLISVSSAGLIVRQ